MLRYWSSYIIHTHKHNIYINRFGPHLDVAVRGYLYIYIHVCVCVWLYLDAEVLVLIYNTHTNTTYI